MFQPLFQMTPLLHLEYTMLYHEPPPPHYLCFLVPEIHGTAKMIISSSLRLLPNAFFASSKLILNDPSLGFFFLTEQSIIIILRVAGNIFHEASFFSRYLVIKSYCNLCFFNIDFFVCIPTSRKHTRQKIHFIVGAIIFCFSFSFSL